MKPLRVTILAGGLRGGGTEKFLRLFLEHVDRRLVEPSVIFVTGDATIEPARAAAQLSCPAHFIGWTRQSSRVGSFLRLTALLRRERPDVVYALQGIITFVGPVAARIAGVRTVVVAQRNMGHDNARRPLRRGLRRLIFAHLVDGIITNADTIRDMLVSSASVPADRIRVVRNPVERRAGLPEEAGAGGPAEPAEERVTIVARLDRIKNHACFLRAAARVAGERAQTRFWVVGTGPLEGQLRQLADAASLRGRVHFTGHSDDVRRIMRRSALVALTSHDEGLPNALLEALSEGTPVVATRVGGVPEIVREAAWLTDPDDDRALAAAMLAVLREPASSRRRASALWNEVAALHDPGATALAQAEALRGFHARG